MAHVDHRRRKQSKTRAIDPPKGVFCLEAYRGKSLKKKTGLTKPDAGGDLARQK